MLSTPPPDEAPEAAALRGRIFTDLDRLAFALEMEAAEELEAGREAASLRIQEQRLGCGWRSGWWRGCGPTRWTDGCSAGRTPTRSG